MVSEKSDQIKLYIVIGLALVAAIVAFFRFVYKPGESDDVSVNAASKPAKIEIPQLITKQSERFQEYETSIDRFSSVNIRDIFHPEIALEKLVSPIETKKLKKPPTPSVFFELKGTITGGENPIAVINGRFVRIGEEVEGYQIISIGPNEVTLMSNNLHKTLEVLKPLDIKQK